MANIILFAPQVLSVQPAFEYKNGEGTVKIYYTLSDFNNYDTFSKIRYRIVDSNRASSWGDNSMIKNDNKYIEIECPSNNGFFDIYLNLTEYKEFTVNQYYQIQIKLVQGFEESPWSQASLIRPIPPLKSFNFYKEGEEYEIGKVKGYIQYEDNSTVEAIKDYYIFIKDKNDRNIVYQSKNINNNLGTHFSAELLDCALVDGQYKMYINYTTINGFNRISDPLLFEIGYQNAQILNLDYWSVKNNSDIGGIDLEFKFADNAFSNVKIYLQRSNEKTNFLKWETVRIIELDNLIDTYKYTDMTPETSILYQYRIVIFSNDLGTFICNKYKDNDLMVLATIENIHFLGEDKQLSIKYNPSITGLKYVTQEALTNTLGGKYPIIRINGDTKYRQFSLSGTLAFDSNHMIFEENLYDSCNTNINQYLKNDSCNILFNLKSLIENFPQKSLQLIKESKEYFEKKYRDIAIKFLTDQKPKVFKGSAEDTMIVYLSGFSFSPQKQLGREIWDFSCTVTEICDFNKENLKKYNLIKNNDISLFYVMQYLLKMKKIERKTNDIVNILDYVPLEETINNIPILHAFWEEKIINSEV